MTDVVVLIGTGSIGQAIARRVGAGQHVLLADLRPDNADAAAKTLTDAGFQVSTATVDVASRDSVHALAETAAGLGPVVGLIHAAGVSPSQASPQIILRVDLYGTALVLEEFGAVIAEGGSGVVIASQSGHRLGALTAEQDHALATTPVEELLALPMLSPDTVTDPLNAYQLSKRGNSLRVMAEPGRAGRHARRGRRPRRPVGGPRRRVRHRQRLPDGRWRHRRVPLRRARPAVTWRPVAPDDRRRLPGPRSPRHGSDRCRRAGFAPATRVGRVATRATGRPLDGGVPDPAGPPREPSEPTQRDRLLGRYRRLVDVELPAAARRDRWALRDNHCFGRVLLDHAVGRCWYEVLDRRAGPAYRQLDDRALAETVDLAERLLREGDPLLRRLDRSSLRWRGKPAKRSEGSPPEIGAPTAGVPPAR